jgi:transposase
MQKNKKIDKQLSLSELIRDPSSLIEDFNELPDDTECVKEYGIGIDCHSKFIEVCVRYRKGKVIHKSQSQFSTKWDDLVSARNWCINVLKTKADPIPDLSEPIHYLVESTASYHMPVCMAFGGDPTIINPTIAGATKRKTDVLDSRLLALHDQLNIWRESYIPNDDVKSLRVMISQRERCLHDATAASNRINNIITRFGLTVGRNGSVVKNPAIRNIVENQISDEPSVIEGICPFPIPMEVRMVLREEYAKYDYFTAQAEECKNKIFEKARSMQWETGTGTLPGDEMIRLLATAPQVGELTAIIWLAKVITPRRFHNAKALSAYCGLDPSLKISAGKVTSTRMRGGNKALHKALNMSAHRLIRNHNEMFGIWGYNLQQQTGKKKKAANAVARKLSVALYYMMKTGTEFTYDNYHSIRNIDVFDIPVEDLVLINNDFKRYIRILKENGIDTTVDLATAYITCSLGSCNGLGKKFFGLLKDFLDHHVTYKEMYDEIQETFNHKEENINGKTKQQNIR